jgi:hypothetical protein
MEAVHHYEGTVNQVMGGGIMALFGAPIAHEDHAVRACYVALRMQDAVRRYSDELRCAQGVEVQIRVGVNSGDVVVRAIGKRVSERMCKQFSVSLPLKGDSHGDRFDDYPRTSRSAACQLRETRGSDRRERAFQTVKESVD